MGAVSNSSAGGFSSNSAVLTLFFVVVSSFAHAVMDAANKRMVPQRSAAMVLTDLCFMLSPPWDNSTLTPIPGKVKSLSYHVWNFI